jgi:hypothetical protein
MQTLTHITVGSPATRRSRFFIAGAALPLVSLLFAAGCGDSQIVAYRVPKEKRAAVAPPSSAADPHASLPAAPASGAGMAATAVATAAGGGLMWTAPAGWQPKTASAMRKATFVIGADSAGDPKNGDASAAELAVTAFPGDVGGEAANVNRWRGQVQLAPVSDAEAVASLTRIEANGLRIAVVDLPNPSAGIRLTGAMVPFDGATWFFKLTGPDAIVAREQPAFLEFLRTLKPASAPAVP